jgi:magnesium transporter
LCAQRPVKIDTLVGEEHVTIPAGMKREQVANLFRRKDLLSAPVIDADGMLIGMITVDDIVDVIAEEAEDDMLKLGGVRDSDIYASAASTVRARFPWLGIDLVTQVVAACVISLFEGTIQKIVALAALMPIVASMGGNAGTQTMTIVVRALATKQLSAANAWRAVRKELAVGLINGLLFAVIIGGATWFWYGDMRLGFVIGTAMGGNFIAAALAGIGIPLLLSRLKIDPAAASTVFLTTVTDVVGFFSFLGLAALLLT